MQLTGIATASFLLVSLLVLTIIWRSVAAGFPAIHTGAYPLWGFGNIREPPLLASSVPCPLSWGCFQHMSACLLRTPDVVRSLCSI